ncbi:MAG: hypothetical protein AAF610_05165 [Pseudomonadota bacterium]
MTSKRLLAGIVISAAYCAASAADTPDSAPARFDLGAKPLTTVLTPPKLRKAEDVTVRCIAQISNKGFIAQVGCYPMRDSQDARRVIRRIEEATVRTTIQPAVVDGRSATVWALFQIRVQGGDRDRTWALYPNHLDDPKLNDMGFIAPQRVSIIYEPTCRTIPVIPLEIRINAVGNADQIAVPPGVNDACYDEIAVIVQNNRFIAARRDGTPEAGVMATSLVQSLRGRERQSLLDQEFERMWYGNY